MRFTFDLLLAQDELRSPLGKLKRFETFSRAVNACSGGYLTVEYGHVVMQEGEQEGFASSSGKEEIELELGALRLITPVFDAFWSVAFSLGGALQCAGGNRADTHACRPSS